LTNDEIIDSDVKYLVDYWWNKVENKVFAYNMIYVVHPLLISLLTTVLNGEFSTSEFVLIYCLLAINILQAFKIIF
jgi:hypothetical protein